MPTPRACAGLARPGGAGTPRRRGRRGSSGVGDGPLGEVVDPLPAAPLGADHLAVCRAATPRRSSSRTSPTTAPPFFAPPSSVAVSGPSARSWSSDRVVASPSGSSCPAAAAGAVGAAAEGEVRPLLDGQDAGGVRPVLEGVAASGPVRALDRARGRRRRAGRTGSARGSGRARRSCRAAPRRGARSTPRTPAAAVGGAEEALGAQGDPAGLVGGQVGGGRRHGRHAPHR